VQSPEILLAVDIELGAHRTDVSERGLFAAVLLSQSRAFARCIRSESEQPRMSEDFSAVVLVVVHAASGIAPRRAANLVMCGRRTADGRKTSVPPYLGIALLLCLVSTPLVLNGRLLPDDCLLLLAVEPLCLFLARFVFLAFSRRLDCA
jgi:hypothetical protein